MRFVGMYPMHFFAPSLQQRWRRRWFVLRHSGELPGQYFLCYYTDRSRRTLKGQIDLDQCEQVDAGLQFENSKHKYQYMFDVCTPKRVYYLAAETESDMNKWVDCVCHVCGLKSYPQDENACESEENSSLVEEVNQTFESPPVSPSSTASGPYIPISECITGKPLASNSGLDDFYDSPRRLRPPGALELRASGSTTPPLQSPGTDAESVFTDEEWTSSKPAVNWDTFPQPTDGSLEDVKSAVFVGKRSYTKPVAPPRPPKPQHLVLQDSTVMHTYTNLDSPQDPGQRSANGLDGNVVNEMYDFPRSHQFNNGEQENIDPIPVPNPRHCYTNAAPSHVGNIVFNYDFAHNSSGDEPVSPNSEASSTAQYSNMSSPVASGHPPAVNRGLKPGRKPSDSISNEPSPQCPNVDLNHLRNLKPTPTQRVKEDLSSLHRIHGKNKEIQYLDLDLDSTPENGNHSTASNSESSLTVYKEVDFVKTEAFNRTKQKVEQERNNAQL
ncbi:unnamed protein product [Nesidiocoris tenuis]|uniref:PH domain-containing protein n=1 Tax=Nesidiocoris tenuis TaxID=355587 RepID=A0A6H5G3P8_9HEMI|nr:unnamed protein product [Nesidiocoris tenuis]